MPSSMIFAGLVVIWLLILVPAVARHRQEVARPSMAALSGRVLERPRQRRDPEQGHDPDIDRDPEVGRRLEVDVMDHVDQQRSVADAAEDWYDDEPGPDDRYDEPAHDDHDWGRSPPRYRRGRGGFDPEAAALTARARYAFRQRVVLAMLVAAIGTGVLAVMVLPGLWWLHAAVDVALVGYLVYLRRQVRLEEAIRQRRAARMAGTRRLSAADDPELDEWARRGRDAVRPTTPPERYADPVDQGDDGAEDGPEPEPDRYDEEAGHPDPDLDLDPVRPDDLSRERPERIRGTGEPVRTAPGPDTEPAPALPRLEPTPSPPLPAGTALVESLDDDPVMHSFDSPVRPDYRRAVGQ